MGEREEPEGGVDSSCGPGVVGVATRRLEPRRESPGDLRFSRLGEVFCRNSLVHIQLLMCAKQEFLVPKIEAGLNSMLWSLQLLFSLGYPIL